MPKVSQHQLSRETEYKIADALVKTLAKIDDEKLLRRFLDNLLTPTEKIMLAKRLMVAVLLQRGYSYSAICRVLKMSKTTVHIIQRELLKSGEGYRRVFDRFFKESKGEQVIKTMERVLGAAPIEGSRRGASRQKRIMKV